MSGEELVKQAYGSILQGDFEQAIRLFEEAIAADPLQADYHYKCSITCARSGKWSKAIHYAAEAIRLKPGEPLYEYQLQTVKARILVTEAKALLGSGIPAYKEAIQLLHEAVSLDPLIEEGLLLLAASYAGIEHYGDAAAYAKEALKLNPQQPEAKRLFAEYNRKRRRHKQSRRPLSQLDERE